jgi:hypothetical protein
MATLISDILRGVMMLGAMIARRRVVVVAVRAALAFAFVGVFAASRASATCGDWLAHPTKASTAENASAADESSSETAAAPTRSPSRPCHGPFCGQAPWAPAAPAPAPIPTFSDHTFAVLALRIADGDEDDAFSCLFLGDADPLAGFGRRIDHPPRA